MTTLAYIGLGSNLGAREAQIDAALEALRRREGVEVRRRSRLHETSPVGGRPQGPYLNGVAELAVGREVTPAGLLEWLLDVERELGRVRVERWGPRPIDLDLLLFGEEILDQPGLILPHPRMRERTFVLRPLAELVGALPLPPDGRTVADLLERIERREGNDGCAPQ